MKMRQNRDRQNCWQQGKQAKLTPDLKEKTIDSFRVSAERILISVSVVPNRSVCVGVCVGGGKL